MAGVKGVGEVIQAGLGGYRSFEASGESMNHWKMALFAAVGLVGFVPSTVWHCVKVLGQVSSAKIQALWHPERLARSALTGHQMTAGLAAQ